MICRSSTTDDQKPRDAEPGEEHDGQMGVLHLVGGAGGGHGVWVIFHDHRDERVMPLTFEVRVLEEILHCHEAALARVGLVRGDLDPEGDLKARDATSPLRRGADRVKQPVETLADRDAGEPENPDLEPTAHRPSAGR